MSVIFVNTLRLVVFLTRVRISLCQVEHARSIPLSSTHFYTLQVRVLLVEQSKKS